MKWDAFVYARGVQRTDGYKMRIQPENFPEEIIQGCQRFFNLRSVNEKRSSWKDIFENDPCAWKKSFMFIAQPKYKSCLLMRAVKVESPETGEVLRDFENREIWSLEGVWCPYDRANLMFACLPSIIMKLSDSKISLRTLLAESGENIIEIEDKYYYNPYEESDGYEHDSPPVPLGIESFESVRERTALRMLARKIKFCGEYFSFFFGPLAEMMMKECADAYNIKDFFSTVNTDSFKTAYPDCFLDIQNAQLAVKTEYSERKKYILRLSVGQSERKDLLFKWSIAESDSFGNTEEVFSQNPRKYSEEKGLSFIKLKAEAEAVRYFAGCMNWEVHQVSDDSYSMYTFFRED